MKTNRGYKIKNGHLKIGTKVHLKDFIYAKRLLQNNFYASGFAFLLTKKIAAEIIEKTKRLDDFNLTLIGYGYYSELLVSRVESFLINQLETNSNINSVNHFIIEDETNINFNKYFTKIKANSYNYFTKTNYYIIITPISATLVTPIKIENEFRKQFDKFQNEKKEVKNRFLFYSLIVIEDEKKDNKLTDIELKFWEESEDEDLNHKIIFTNNRERQNDGKRENHFFIKLKTKWYLPNKCELCFPDNLIEESPLFFTDKVSVTPSYNFGIPNMYYDEQASEHIIYFGGTESAKEKKEYPTIDSNMINFGHHKGTSKHFFYYIIYEKVFEKNRAKILHWTKNLHEVINKELSNPNDNILLITPDKSENGLFVNFINEKVFNGRANILNIKADNENIHDFNMFFEYEIKKAKSIFYIDNLLATANSFFLVNDLIKLHKQESIEESVNYQPFDGIFTLINRMDKYTVKNVKRKLNKKNIYSFMNLFFTVIQIHDNPIKECHLCRKEQIFKDLVNNSALDTLKLFINKRILKKIIIKDKSAVYSNQGTDRQLHRLFVSHYLFASFSKEKDDCKINRFFENQNNNDFDDFERVFFNKEFNKYCYIESDNIKNKITILKVLSEPPFIEYKRIKEKVFRWTLFEIDKFIEDNEKKEISIFDIDYLKILIKTLAVLKSNYLLSVKFFVFIVKLLNKYSDFDKINTERNDTLKQKKAEYEKIQNENIQLSLYSNNDEIVKTILKIENEIKFINKIKTFKLYIVAYIKVSILYNESKTIKLEEVLNSKEIRSIALLTESKRFIELIRLENIDLLKVMFSIQENVFNYSSKINNLDYNNKEIHIDQSQINKNINEIEDIIEEEKIKNNLKIVNIWNFVESNKNEKPLYYLMLLNRFLSLTSLKNNVKIFRDSVEIDKEEIFEEKANYLLNLITKIINVDVSKGGGLLIFKSKEMSEDESDFTIISSIGSTAVRDDFNESLSNNLFCTNEFISGYKYMEDTVEDKTFNYEWSSIAAYSTSNKWHLQDDNEFKYEEARIGDNRKQNRFNFIRISTLKADEINGEGVIVLFDNSTKQFSQSRIRYILSIRNKVADFLDVNYNNDAYRNWIEKKNIADIIESRFHKFRHGAGEHLDLFMEKLRTKDKSLFAFSHIIKVDIWFGNLLSNYLSKTGEFSNKNDGGYVYSKKSFKKEIEEIIENSNEYLEELYPKDEIIITYDISVISSDIISFIKKSILKYFILEIFINAFRNSSNKMHFGIKFNDQQIKLSSENSIIKNNINVQLIYKHIQKKYPTKTGKISGIGLFTINKYLNYHLGDEIKIHISSNNDFEITIPLKKCKLYENTNINY